MLWGVGGTAALAVILLSCSTTTRTILAPPSIPGAEFVGSEECRTCHEEIVRDFRTATHARLQRTKTEIVNKSGGKGSEAKGTTVKQSTDMGCESCHGPGQSAREKRRRGAHDHQSEERSADLFPMSLGSARAIPIASPSSGAGRQNELRRLSQPAQGNRDQRRRGPISSRCSKPAVLLS